MTLLAWPTELADLSSHLKRQITQDQFETSAAMARLRRRFAVPLNWIYDVDPPNLLLDLARKLLRDNVPAASSRLRALAG